MYVERDYLAIRQCGGVVLNPVGYLVVHHIEVVGPKASESLPYLVIWPTDKRCHELVEISLHLRQVFIDGLSDRVLDLSGVVVTHALSIRRAATHKANPRQWSSGTHRT